MGLVTTLAAKSVTDPLVTAHAMRGGTDPNCATVSPSCKARSRGSLDDETVGLALELRPWRRRGCF